METTQTVQDQNQKKRDDFWNSLDLAPVNEYFGKLLGVKLDLQKQRAEGRHGQIHYGLADETNIAPLNPITNTAWEKMTVETFGSWLNLDKETGEPWYAGTIHLAYQHHRGGTNGAHIGDVRFSKGKWEIEAYCEKGAR